MEVKKQNKVLRFIVISFTTVITAWMLLYIYTIYFYDHHARRYTSAHDLSNVKQLGIAVLMYSEDNEGLMPLAHGIDQRGRHGYNYYKYVPAGWSSSPSLRDRVEYSRPFVLNSLRPYIKNEQILASPFAEEFLLFSRESVASGKQKVKTTYAYNGLLHTYPSEAIASVSKLPVFTPSNGNRVAVGAGLANPALVCDRAFEPCDFRPRTQSGCQDMNGGKGVMFTKFDGNKSSYWMYKKGQNWSFADSHAKYRKVGETQSPGATDYEVDPWTNYNDEGHASQYWWDGCHPWLFRPDYDFDEEAIQ